MKQQTFSDFEYSNRKRKTKREEFLEIMDGIIPWDEWGGIIMPFYPSGKRGRPPKGVELMLRMYLVQVWFNLSDEGTEDAIYDSYAIRVGQSRANTRRSVVRGHCALFRGKRESFPQQGR